MDGKPSYEELGKRVEDLQEKAANGRRAEEELRAMHEMMRASFDAIQDGINVVDLDFNIIDINDVLLKAFGLSDRESVIGRKCFEVLKGRKEVCPHCKVVEAYRTSSPARRTTTPEDEAKTGGRSFEIFAYPILDQDGGLTGAVEFSRDITERKQMEEEQARMRMQREGLWNLARMVDVDHKTLCDNVLDQLLVMTQSKYAFYGFLNEDESVLKVYSWSKEVLNKCVVSGRPLEFFINRGGLWTAAVRERKALIINDYKADHPDKIGIPEGHVELTRLLVVPVFVRGRIVALSTVANKSSDYTEEDAKQVEAFCSNAQTILDRKDAENRLREHLDHLDKRVKERTIELEEEVARHEQTEAALRESEQDKTNILQTMSELVVYVDTNMKILWANRAAADSLGVTPDDLLGKYCYKEWFQADAPCLFCPAKKILETGESSEGETQSPDGRVWLFRGYPVKDENGKITGFVEVVQDITEAKRFEIQLQQAQKMEAIGTLAGGIAHDFNNLLMGIQGHASLMLLNVDSGHAHFGHLKGIEASVERAAYLTRQLLGFARGGKYEVKSTDLNLLIEKNSDMFGRTKKEIRIHKKYEKKIWPVELDQGQIDQVLLNLYVNAWQAMPGGGDLYIDTSNVLLDDNYVEPFGVTPGNYVKISVTDTGVGMDEAVRKRIFEPFFTTKEIGSGTGLGLASAYGIIRNHGGIINVYSEKGKGTTFNIYLPASQKEVSSEEKRPEEEILKGTETILFVDDEDIVLDVGRDILEAMGYKVLSARSGKEAVEIYGKHKDEIDLVVLDMVLSDMGGGEVYDIMKEADPDIKVLLSSGYSVQGQASGILERGCDGFIQKPFDIKALSHTIREILDK
ncbi:MAG: PAS domain-containing protein [Desulfobulbaceae bacterium]|nr:PAS domain-containing protein [Desulfobulbaceae bacterium]